MRGSLAAAMSLVRARLGADRPGTLLLLLLMLVTAFVFSAAPLLLNRIADDGLRHALSSAAPSERSLEFSRLGRLEPGAADALENVAAEGADLQAQFPSVLRDLVETREFLYETIPYDVIQGPRSLTHVELRYQSSIEQHITLSEGRLPTTATTIAEVPPEISPDGKGGRAVVYEVAVSAQTADELRGGVGERLLMTPDRTITLPGFGGWQGTFTGIDIVGIYDVPAPEDTYWLNDWALYRPTLVPVTLDTFEVHATALLAPDSYRTFSEPQFAADGSEIRTAIFPFHYAWRYYVDLGRLHAGLIEELSRQLTRLEANYPFRSQSLESDVPSIQTAMPRIIEAYLGQRQTTEAALAVAAVGPAAAAAGALALVALLQGRRRTNAILLVHGRGASSAQILLAQLIEALLLAVPAAVAGYLLASVAIGARVSGAAQLAGVAVVAVSVAILVAVALPLARAPLSTARADSTVRLQSRARRLVFDGVIVAIALIGVMLLRARGVLGGGPVDPYLAAVPALVGLAVGVIALRLYPLPIRFLAWLAARGRGISAPLALRTAARDVRGAQLPLLVLMLATTMGVFSSAVLVTVQDGQRASSYQQVGADFRIDAGLADIIPAELTVSALPGLEAEARAFIEEAIFRGGQVRRGDAFLQALDAPGYAAVLAGTPADPRLPAEFMSDSWPSETGSEELPLPAIITRQLADGARLGPSGVFELTIPGGRRSFRIVEVRDRFPGTSTTTNMIVVPYAALAASFPDRPLSPTTLYVRGAEAGEQAIRDAIAPYARRLAVVSRPQVFERLSDVPLAAAVTDGLALALLVTLAYSALALTCGLVLALAARRRELALLRTLGLRARQVMALVLLEHGPAILVALAVGVALGVGLAWLIEPGLRLEAFTGPGVEVLLRLDPLHLLVLGVVPVAIVATAVLLGAFFVQRGQLAGLVRGSDAQAGDRSGDE